MENKEKKILKKGDKIQLKIAGLNTKGRAYGFYGDDENRIFPNINAAEGQIVEGIFVKRRRKYEHTDTERATKYRGRYVFYRLYRE